MKKITIATSGTSSDVQPYVALALALRDNAHHPYDVRFVANEDHVHVVERQFGFPIAPVFPSMEEPMRTHPKLSAALAEGCLTKFSHAMKEISDQQKGGTVMHDFLQEMETHRPDLLLQGTYTEYFTSYAAYFYNIPVLSVKVSVFCFDEKRPLHGVPKLPFGLHNYALKKIILTAAHNVWKQMDDFTVALLLQDNNDKDDNNDDKKKKKKSTSSRRLTDIMPLQKFSSLALHPQLPHIMCTSSLVRDILYRTADHDMHHFIGPCVVVTDSPTNNNNNNKQLSLANDIDGSGGASKDDLVLMKQFLTADPSRKPVCCGWGRMICKSPKHMIKLVVHALQLSEERAIVLSGWAGLSQKLLEASTRDAKLIKYAKENILFVNDDANDNDKVPLSSYYYEWLFAQASCTVHHGEAYAFHAALRSGTPTIVTPVFLGQFDYAHAVNELGNGIGFKKQFQKLSAHDLATAIRSVLNKKKDGALYAKRAADVRAHVRAEKGAAGGVAEIETFWRDYVETGRYESMIQTSLKEAGYDSNGNPPSK